MADASAKVATAVPSTETMTSPGSMPAATEGAGGSAAVHSVAPAAGTHSDSAATVVVAVWTPIPLKMIVNSTIARRRFITGPPSMMTTRFQTGSR